MPPPPPPGSDGRGRPGGWLAGGQTARPGGPASGKSGQTCQTSKETVQQCLLASTHTLTSAHTSPHLIRVRVSTLTCQVMLCSWFSEIFHGQAENSRLGQGMYYAGIQFQVYGTPMDKVLLQGQLFPPHLESRV